MTNNDEIYVSTDIEADGPIPGINSMLSFGSAAFRLDGDNQLQLIDTFAANLETADGATADEKTMAWWQQQPDAWASCRKNTVAPASAMAAYVHWLENLPGKPVMVGYPVAFDFMFIHWYLIRYVGRSPFSHSALDIKTLAMCALKKPYRQSTKRNMPKRWFSKQAHTHQALDDALEQGYLFGAIMHELNTPS